ncbi:MAG TPA: YdcH family protein [Silvibacterium sp.]|nr:YdcH family protein [Silvibacterium sp.]
MDVDAIDLPDSEAIHKLEEQHRHYSEQLEALLQKPYPSDQEQLEEVRLKKLKLYVKDQLVARRSSHHQGAYVA